MRKFDRPPRTSVILVTWNSTIHLPRCLDCLAAQTLKDFEVVLVDNGSTAPDDSMRMNKYSQYLLANEKIDLQAVRRDIEIQIRNNPELLPKGILDMIWIIGSPIDESRDH